VPFSKLFGTISTDREEYEKTRFFQDVFVENKNHPLTLLDLEDPLYEKEIASYVARTLFLCRKDIEAIEIGSIPIPSLREGSNQCIVQ
jgi:hypothetical protein